MPASPHPDSSNVRDGDLVEPATMVDDMASAIERVRRMATTVFQGDAALFADLSDQAPT